jgi:hypothetical protein
LFHLLITSTTIAAAGEHGPYFLALCGDSHPDTYPDRSDMTHRSQPE